MTERIDSDAEDESALEQLKHAMWDGHAPRARQLLAQHPSLRDAINRPIFSFDAPALVMVGDDAAMVDVLLDFGADPNRKSDWWAGGFHPLYGVSAPVAERLIAAGAIVDACAASHLDRIDLMTGLLAQDPGRVHERGGDGQMPLHFARSREMIDLLLASGADLDARDIDHRSTAAEWMMDNRRELAAYLVDRGARSDIFLASVLGFVERATVLARADVSVLDLRTGQGEYGEQAPSSYHISFWTIGQNVGPLEAAAKFGQDDVVRALLEIANPTQRLLFACHQGNADEARAIVAEHPSIVARLRGADRRALTDEAWNGNSAAVALMLALGFDPSVPSESGPTGGTALHCAAWRGSEPTVAALLEDRRGRELLSVRDAKYHGTPLSWCCHGSTNCGDPSANHPGVARMLIAAGAAIDANLQECSSDMRAVLVEHEAS